MRMLNETVFGPILRISDKSVKSIGGVQGERSFGRFPLGWDYVHNLHLLITSFSSTFFLRFQNHLYFPFLLNLCTSLAPFPFNLSKSFWVTSADFPHLISSANLRSSLHNNWSFRWKSDGLDQIIIQCRQLKITTDNSQSAV